MSEEILKFMSALKKDTGLSLNEEKIYLIESRLSGLMEDYKMSSYQELTDRFQNHSDKEFREKVIDRITTHETKFFRDDGLFEALVSRIIPELLEQRAQSNANSTGSNLKIWCAACSTGQEPYSIAMEIKEKAPEIFKKTKIFATDIAYDTLIKAKSGIYSNFEISRGLDTKYLNKYFTKISDTEYQINDEIKSIVEFKYQNLISDDFPTGFDLILCRNVSYYFDHDDRRKLFKKIEKSMNPDSFLILGTAESITDYSSTFIVREFGKFRYYELNPTNVTFFSKGA